MECMKTVTCESKLADPKRYRNLFVYAGHLGRSIGGKIFNDPLQEFECLYRILMVEVFLWDANPL